MVIMVLDDILLNLEVLIGKVCGNSFEKDGEDFLIIFPSMLVLVLLFSLAQSLVSRGSSTGISSPLFMCLL